MKRSPLPISSDPAFSVLFFQPFFSVGCNVFFFFHTITSNLLSLRPLFFFPRLTHLALDPLQVMFITYIFPLPNFKFFSVATPLRPKIKTPPPKFTFSPPKTIRHIFPPFSFVFFPAETFCTPSLSSKPPPPPAILLFQKTHPLLVLGVSFSCLFLRVVCSVGVWFRGVFGEFVGGVGFFWCWPGASGLLFPKNLYSPQQGRSLLFPSQPPAEVYVLFL